MKPNKKLPAVLFFLFIWTPLSLAAGLYVGAVVFVGKASLKAEPSLTLLPKAWVAAKLSATTKQALMMGTAAAALAALVPMVFFAVLLLMKPKRELHGSSRFATAAEIAQAGLLMPPKKYRKAEYPDILVGKFKGKYLRWASNEFMFLAARTRSGKGVSTVVPNCLHYAHSMVIYDPKLENYLISAGFRATMLKQKVFLFNPSGKMPEHETNPTQPPMSHRWNPMTYIRRNPLYAYKDLSNMAKILIPKSPKDTGTSNFFTDNARKLFVGLGLYLIETESERDLADYRQRTTLTNLFKLTVPQDGSTLFEWIKNELDSRNEAGKPLSEQAQTLLRAFANSNAKSGNDVLSTMTTPLGIFLDPVVEAVTSADDFRLDKVRQELMTIYVGVIPTEAETFSRLLNLFFSQLVNVNVEQGLPENNVVRGKTKFPYQCLLLMDEFTALGAVPAISEGVSYIAGYGLRLLIIIQAPSQVEAVYGRDNMRTFFTNFTMRVFFTPREQWEAEEYSKIIGDETFKAKSRSSSMGKGSSTSTSDQRRAVMNPDEIKRMPMENCVIDMAGVPAVYAEKIVYWRDPVFKERALMPPPQIPVLEVVLKQGQRNSITPARTEDIPAEELPATDPRTIGNAAEMAFCLAKGNVRAGDDQDFIIRQAENAAQTFAVDSRPLLAKLLDYVGKLEKQAA